VTSWDPKRAERRAGLFGGEGHVLVWDLSRGAPPPFTAAVGCELSVGGSVGRHRQEREAELVIGISGRGVAEVDGEARELVAGSVVPVALGSVLSLRCEGDEVLRYVIVKAS